MNTNNIKLFSQKELERYSRHIIIPEVGIEGQKKLKQASVLIIGAGGLGSPIAMYLSAAGAGRIGVIDFDVVSYSNLQRQIIYSTDDVGNSKVEVVVKKLKQINPDIVIEPYNVKLSSANALEIINNYDVIADGSDNFATRYLVNDACVLLRKPLVYGSVLRFKGQVTVFDSSKGPCYRCLFPQPPEPGEVPSCADAGVLGVLPGIIGSIQASEVIKLIIGKGDSLIGRLLLFDALKIKFSEIKVDKDISCKICSENPTIKKLIDYEEFCNSSVRNVSDEKEISVKELKMKMDNGDKFRLIDVREAFEKQISNIGGELIPINSLPSRMDELNKEEEIILYCRTGHRSENAVEFLKRNGFKNVKNLIGGIYAWSDNIDSSVIKY